MFVKHIYLYPCCPVSVETNMQHMVAKHRSVLLTIQPSLGHYPHVLQQFGSNIDLEHHQHCGSLDRIDWGSVTSCHLQFLLPPPAIVFGLAKVPLLPSFLPSFLPCPHVTASASSIGARMDLHTTASARSVWHLHTIESEREREIEREREQRVPAQSGHADCTP